MKVIKFGAIWCPACLVMRPRYNKVLSNYDDIEVIEYDYDIDNDMVKDYNIGKLLPEVIFMDDDDNELERIVGEVSIKKIEEIVLKYRK